MVEKKPYFRVAKKNPSKQLQHPITFDSSESFL